MKRAAWQVADGCRSPRLAAESGGVYRTIDDVDGP
jgi:hypothetical protein